MSHRSGKRRPRGNIRAAIVMAGIRVGLNMRNNVCILSDGSCVCARLSYIVLQKNLMWNTVTVQYNPLIEEEFDEHFKVTCEYGYDFWKTVTFPFLDVE